MEVEVLGGEVRPHGGVEVDRVNPLQSEGVGGGLQHRRPRPGIDHFPQDRLHLRGFRGGEVVGELPQYSIREFVTDRGEQTGAEPGLAVQMPGEPRRRRLSVCPGDSHDGELLLGRRRGPRRLGERGPGVETSGTAGTVSPRAALHQRRRSRRRPRVGDERVPIGAGAADRNEHVPRLRPRGVVVTPVISSHPRVAGAWAGELRQGSRRVHARAWLWVTAAAGVT